MPENGGPWPQEKTADLDTARAHSARVYDYWLGGKDNFAADREAAEQALTGQRSRASSTGLSSSSRAWSSPSGGGPERTFPARPR